MYDAPDAPEPRARRVLRTLGEWAVVLVAALALSTAVGRLRAPDLPDPRPTWQVTDLDGAPVDLDALRGRPVVLNFWATWCGPCRAELPMIAAWARSHPDVAVLAVSVDDDLRMLRRVAPSYDLPFPIVHASVATQRAWSVTTLPTTFVLDADGRVVAAHTGLLTPPQLSWMVP